MPNDPSERIVVHNYYYAKPGQAEAVYNGASMPATCALSLDFHAGGSCVELRNPTLNPRAYGQM